MPSKPPKTVKPSKKSKSSIIDENQPTTSTEKTKSEQKSNSDRESRSKRAGLQFPVGRIHSSLKKGNYAKRIGNGAPVYLAGF